MRAILNALTLFCLVSSSSIPASKKPQVELIWNQSFSEWGVEKAAEDDLKGWIPLRAPGTSVVEKSAEEIFEKAARRVQNMMAKDEVPIWNPEISEAEFTKYNRMAKWSAASYCSQDSLLSWSCGPRCEG